MPKSITGSVGRGGRNFPPSDVMTIQYMLNCLTPAQGGPGKELLMDGAAGPATIAAIVAFQRKIGGVADGRVDPGGTTFRALQKSDPYPNQSLAADAAKGGVGGKAKSGYSGNDPFAKQGGFGSPAGKDAFGKDAFGNKTGQPPAKTGVDPFGNKTGGGMAMPGFPAAAKAGEAPMKGGGGMIN